MKNGFQYLEKYEQPYFHYNLNFFKMLEMTRIYSGMGTVTSTDGTIVYMKESTSYPLPTSLPAYKIQDIIYTEQSLYKAMFGIHRTGPCYKRTVL